MGYLIPGCGCAVSTVPYDKRGSLSDFN